MISMLRRNIGVFLGGAVGAAIAWILIPPRETVRDVYLPEPSLIGNELYAELKVERSNAAALRALPIDDVEAWHDARRIHAILDTEAWTVASRIGGAAPDEYLRHFGFTDFGSGRYAEEALAQRKTESDLVRLRNALSRHGQCIDGPPKAEKVQFALNKVRAERGEASVDLSSMSPEAIDALASTLLQEMDRQGPAGPPWMEADVGDWEPSVDAVTGCWQKLPGLIRESSDGGYLEIRRYERGVEDRQADTLEALRSKSFSRLKASPAGLHANGPRGYAYDEFIWTRMSEDLMVAEVRGGMCPLLPTVDVYRKVEC